VEPPITGWICTHPNQRQRLSLHNQAAGFERLGDPARGCRSTALVGSSVHAVVGDESDGRWYGFFTPGFDGDRSLEFGVGEVIAPGGLAQSLECSPPKRRAKRRRRRGSRWTVRR
jgi:hypothetical protein